MLQAEIAVNRTASLRHLERAGEAFALYLGGRFAAASDGGTRELVDPATGEAIGRVAEATAEDAARAIALARAAFDEGPWPQTPALERARLLNKLADALDANAADFAALETLNCGKPLREAEYDVADAANCFRYYAGLATKPHGQTFEVPAPSQSFTVREPVGVCGQIVPWNYPLLMTVWKLAPAFAAGNVCILKPSEYTPLSALWLAKLTAEAGFPDGVLSVLPGAGPVAGAALAESMLVDKIAFTGSVPTGQTIMRAAACNVKKISLELGGKSPNIVFADADFETAIDYALFGIYANAGQVCSAGSRLVVERSIAGRFVAELVRRADKIVVGDGFDPETEMGPLVSRQQRDRVEKYIALGRVRGRDARLRRDTISGPPSGSAVISSCRRSSPTRRRRCGSCAKRSSGPSSSFRSSPMKPTPFALRTTRRTAWPAPSSRATGRARSASCANCAPASPGSTPTTRPTMRRPGAVTNSRASAANSARTVSKPIPKSNKSTSISPSSRAVGSRPKGGI